MTGQTQVSAETAGETPVTHPDEPEDGPTHPINLPAAYRPQQQYRPYQVPSRTWPPQSIHMYQSQAPFAPPGWSDKSKVAAGLLQLLPGFFLSVGGIGRLYAGHGGLGAAQLALSVLGWIFLVCAWWMVIPVIVFAGLWIWFVVDGIVLLAGQAVDGHGRPMR